MLNLIWVSSPNALNFSVVWFAGRNWKHNLIFCLSTWCCSESYRGVGSGLTLLNFKARWDQSRWHPSTDCQPNSSELDNVICYLRWWVASYFRYVHTSLPDRAMFNWLVVGRLGACHVNHYYTSLWEILYIRTWECSVQNVKRPILRLLLNAYIDFYDYYR